ncbi:MAG: SLC45 family MFS transporter [Barnesiella sp.]|nr:SLC45 family MFS transporter [Barnesiella sp.]MBD5343892.1 SLC45 family MFS transporter [Bacteroides sp.]
MWTYTNGTIAINSFDTPSITKVKGVEIDGKEYQAKYILDEDNNLLVSEGKLLMAGIADINGNYYPADMVEVVRPGAANDTLAIDGMITTDNGMPVRDFLHDYDTEGASLMINHNIVLDSITTYAFISRLSENRNAPIVLCDIYTHDPNTGELYTEGTSKIEIPAGALPEPVYVEELNTESSQYNDAGNWVGILFAVQAIGSVLWAVVLPRFRSRKFSYALSLLLGAAGFISAGLLTNQYLLFISFVLIGCAWAAMLAWPFTILTNSLKGGHIGAYLGLFNCSICIPQIIGALLGGPILSLFGNPGEVAPQYVMMIIAGVALIIGAACVGFIRETSSEK